MARFYVRFLRFTAFECVSLMTELHQSSQAGRDTLIYAIVYFIFFCYLLRQFVLGFLWNSDHFRETGYPITALHIRQAFTGRQASTGRKPLNAYHTGMH